MDLASKWYLEAKRVPLSFGLPLARFLCRDVAASPIVHRHADLLLHALATLTDLLSRAEARIGVAELHEPAGSLLVACRSLGLEIGPELAFLPRPLVPVKP